MGGDQTLYIDAEKSVNFLQECQRMKKMIKDFMD